MANNSGFKAVTYDSEGLQAQIEEAINKQSFSLSVVAHPSTIYNVQFKISDNTNAAWRNSSDFDGLTGNRTLTTFMPLFGLRFDIISLTQEDVNVELQLK